MIPWETIGDELLKLIESLAFSPQPQDFKGRWWGRAQRATSTKVKTDLFLQVRSIQNIGEDETRQTIVDGVAYNSQHGNRRLILEIRVESHQNSNALWSWTTIERIRTRLRRPTSIARLSALNLAFVTMGPSIGLPTPRDDHEWSAASLELTLGYRFEDIDMTDKFNWIEKIELTSRVQDVTGAQLPTPPNGTTTVDAS